MPVRKCRSEQVRVESQDVRSISWFAEHIAPDNTRHSWSNLDRLLPAGSRRPIVQHHSRQALRYNQDNPVEGDDSLGFGSSWVGSKLLDDAKEGR